MISDEQTDQLNAVVEKLLGRDARRATVVDAFSPPFDISRPNIHDSKKEFLLELAAVEAIIAHLGGILSQLADPERKEDADRNAMVERLSSAIELAAVQESKRRGIRWASDLALKNLHETGFFYGSLRVISDLLGAHNQRLIELRDQERQFWTISHRSPNYYARTIALRLARLYAREKSRRPTFGISSEGNHPSTDFGRALEDVYRILKIKASIRSSAVFAIEQLTDDDIRPQTNALGGLFNFMDPSRWNSENALGAPPPD